MKRSVYTCGQHLSGKESKFMIKKELFKILGVSAALMFCAQSAHAEKVLKLGTVGFIGGMDIPLIRKFVHFHQVQP